MERQSFETLDVDDLEEIADESGARRMPAAPRGLWSDAPPPLPKSAVAPHALDSLDLAEPASEPARSERLDFDDLVEGLSSRPAPMPASTDWDLSTIELPPPPPMPAVRPAAPGRARRALLVLAGVAILAYALGVGTMSLLERPAETEPRALRAERVAIDPIVIDRAASEEPVIAEPVIEPAQAPVEATNEVAPVIEPPRANVPAPSRARSVTREVEERVDEAVADEAVAETAASEDTAVEESAPSDLPESPAREDVLAAMAGAQPEIEACATDADRGQLARVRFSFASDGRPAHTNVQGVSGSTASCIATAARRVRVPAFSRDRFVIEFPFQL